MRSTAAIRRHLFLQRLYERVIRIGKDSLQDLKQNDIQLLNVETRDFDILVEYKCQGRLYEALYPIRMLVAEIEGWFKQSSYLSEEVLGE